MGGMTQTKMEEKEFSGDIELNAGADELPVILAPDGTEMERSADEELSLIHI